MSTTTPRTRSWWGWGWEDAALSDRDCLAYGALLPGLAETPIPPPEIRELELRPPRLSAPASLGRFVSVDPRDRASHTYGKAYRDVVRALHRQLDNAPDLVARPTSERDVVDLLDWASRSDVAVIPFGGGSSVVGGVEYDGGDHAGVVSLDLTELNRVLEIDHDSRAARIEAGAFGP
ncbi:MAG: FAD-dependent oxidoreductase, partial [Actinobacteria bacterium]|nr:FAD-dependent oxidoreductase [Actinomycetota bacterium]